MTRLRLEVIHRGRTLSVLEPDGDVVHIGRGRSGQVLSGDNDITIDDPVVMPEHARVVLRDEAVLLEDPGGAGGVTVRRGAARFAVHTGSPHVLASGDVIELGADSDAAAPVQIRVECEAETEAPRVFETRPLAKLAGGNAVSAKADPVLRTLSELQRAVGSADDMAGVLRAVADAALILVPRATHATLVLREELGSGPDESPLVPVLTRVRGPDGAGMTPTTPVRVARSVFRKVVRERAAVLVADATSGELSSESLQGASIQSTIGVPLWRKEDIIGVLQIDNRAAPAMFTSGDVDAVAVLAANASLAVANARLIHRLEVTEEQLERENSFLKGRERARRGGAAETIGQSPAFTALLSQIGKVADTRVSVLIEGETGSGKELVAAALHYRSRRRERLFVAQNCAALPENLLESELFGHKKGAFTGAMEDRRGLFELADGGTLFLDEVTETPLALQAKLLRVLQEGEVRPVGASQTKHVDVRIVAATNRNLEREVAEGRFREDLYYRLKVFPLEVPPLRERRPDIPLLAGHFLERYSSELGKPVAGYAQGAMELLMAYEWPGNVRELENEVQRLVIQVVPGSFVTEALLSAKIRKAETALRDAGAPKLRGSLKDVMEQVERHVVSEALREHGNNKTSAAKALGITREGLHKKLKLLGIG
ncbi:MAG TPA: sigma 54-interacting transcriptional regulator [Polyangiaceae bacterium]|jgi:Nif-specific regulatory protein|nr:sigma 54-interacting transcriptional regulator [Polyangiaceae bacterium]